MDTGIRFDIAYETMPWHKVDAVAFDIGNVLVEYPPEKLVAGLYPDDPQKQAHMLRYVYGGPQWQEIDRGTLDFERAARQIAEGGVYPYEDYLNVFLTGIELKELIEEGWRAAERCRRAGKRLYLLSNYSREGYRALRERFADRFALFDGAVISYELLMLKPERGIYEALLKRFSLEADRLLFIDDLLPNVEGARACGISAFHYAAPGALDRFFL